MRQLAENSHLEAPNGCRFGLLFPGLHSVQPFSLSQALLCSTSSGEIPRMKIMLPVSNSFSHLIQHAADSNIIFGQA